MATQTVTQTQPPAQVYSPPETESVELSLKTPAKSLKEISRRLGNASRRRDSSEDPSDDIRSDVPPPVTATAPPQHWNKPRGNIARLAFAFFSFVIAGMNDAAIGPLIPSLETYYNTNYTIISLIFLTPFAGYSAAAFCNATIHTRFGQRGIAIGAPVCHLITYIVISQHPPFPVLVVANTLSGFGNGLTDAAFCAWVGVMANPNAVQGVMHSCYSLGALSAPLIATGMIVSAHLPWYSFYYVMTGAAALELLGLTLAFRSKSGLVYRTEHPRDSHATGGRTKQALRTRTTWIAALFFFVYMGIEVGLGGWVVSFMLRVRAASPYASGMAGTGFWAGQAVGRAALGFVTERFGERRCVTLYLALALALQLVFWLVPRFVVSAVAVALLGFFLGPMFPGCVIMTAKLMPKHLHVSALGFATAIGGTGGTVFPFIIGAVAAARSVEVLQPIILSLLVVLLGTWWAFPRIKKREQ